MNPPFPDLQSFAAELERQGELVRVRVEVDPYLEAAELVQRVIRQDGPALILERVKGADFPMALNLFGSEKRIELALGRHPEAIGQELLGLVERLNPPTPAAFWGVPVAPVGGDPTTARGVTTSGLRRLPPLDRRAFNRPVHELLEPAFERFC